MNLLGFFAFLNTFFSPKSEFTPQSETTSIPAPFIWESPTPHPPKKNLLHIQGFTLTKVIKQRLEQLEISEWLSLEIFQRYSQFCKLTLLASPKLFARVTFIGKGLCNNYQKERGGGGGLKNQMGGGIK